MKKTLPNFFHRLRLESQSVINIGFLGDNFTSVKEMRINYAYFGISDEKISKTVFSLTMPDKMTEHLREQADEWFALYGDKAYDIANAIYNKKIDILIALSDGKLVREILSYRPAPIQVAAGAAISLKDAFDKNNAPYVDVYFGDDYIVASEGIETVKFNSAFCYLPFFGDAMVKTKEHSEVIFGAIYNESDKRLPMWKNFDEILKSVPNSKLRLFSECFNDEKNIIVAKKRLAWANISEDKIETCRIKDSDDFAYLSSADVLLDAYPNGENVLLLDALYMGVPVVSMTSAARSVLSAAGLSELAATDDASYVNAAAAVGNDAELREALKSGLRKIVESSPLMNKNDCLNTFKSAVFALFDYLVSLKENVPTDEEVKVLWNIFENESEEDVNKYALMDRILLSRPTDPDMLNYIAVMIARDDAAHIKEALKYLPENSLTEKFCSLALANQEKNWDVAEKLALELKNAKTENTEEDNIISTALHILADVYKATGRFKESAEEYLESAKRTPEKTKSNTYERYSNYLLMLHYTDATPKEMYEAAKGYADLFVNIPRFTHYKRRRGKIRVGYISADFRNHVVSNFASAFFQARNKDKFETFAYMTKPEDSNTVIFKNIADNYRNLRLMKYDECAKTIYNDKIDILVDLGGHTGENPLPILARKPAPVQVSGIGYFSTTGLPEVDYFIVDEHTAPVGEDAFFTEKLIRLKHSHFCLTHTKTRPQILQPVSFERNGCITFGSMNKTDKATDKVMEVWKRILDRVPNSRLFLKYGIYDDPWRLKAEKERMERIGFDLSRVYFEGFTNLYLNRYNDMDIALDTFPYPGGGTTCDALLMNVPVVTLEGNSNHERFGKSILENIGLDDLVAKSTDEYVDIAVNLAADTERLKKYHSEIYDRMTRSAIMDQSIYMKDLEEAYEKIFGDWLES